MDLNLTLLPFNSDGALQKTALAECTAAALVTSCYHGGNLDTTPNMAQQSLGLCIILGLCRQDDTGTHFCTGTRAETIYSYCFTAHPA